MCKNVHACVQFFTYLLRNKPLFDRIKFKARHCIYSSHTCSSFDGVTKSMGRCCGPSDCMESTPDPPAVIHPDPTGASRFVVKKCSRLNKDYVVYSKRVNESKKWLFLNQSQDETTEKGGEKWWYELKN